jgi:hypothetical protein
MGGDRKPTHTLLRRPFAVAAEMRSRLSKGLAANASQCPLHPFWPSRSGARWQPGKLRA